MRVQHTLILSPLFVSRQLFKSRSAGHSVWYTWCAKSHWNRFFSELVGCSLVTIFHQCSIIIFYMFLLPEDKRAKPGNCQIGEHCLQKNFHIYLVNKGLVSSTQVMRDLTFSHQWWWRFRPSKNTTSCWLINIYRRFGRICCLHLLGPCSPLFFNFLPIDTVSYPRRHVSADMSLLCSTMCRHEIW